MALLKKKDETTATADEAADPVAPAPEDLLGDAGGGAADGGDPPDVTAPETPVQTVEAAPDADDLLRMFQDSDSASSDLKPLLDLTDEVELSELVDELHTLASALGARGG
jgi:hypothetical protein